MTFQAPAILWLLPLSLLPLIIHLLSKQRSKRIEFPSLKFLKMLQQDALRRFNLKQLILLIIRILMLFLLILAAARPVADFNRMGEWRLNAGRFLLVVMDNSASMQSDWTGDLPARLGDLRESLGEQGFKVQYLGVTDPIISDDPESISAEWGTSHLDSLERFLEARVDIDRFLEKDILFWTDGQHLDSWLAGLDTSEWTLFHVGVQDLEDIALLDIELPSVGVRSGDRYQLKTSYAMSAAGSEGYPLELSIAGERMNQTYLQRTVGTRGRVTIQSEVGNVGIQQGRVLVSGDALTGNNQRYFSLPAYRELDLLVIREPRQMDPWQVLKEAGAAVTSGLSLRLTSSIQLDGESFPAPGTIILQDSERLAPYQIDRLRQFVENGGQVILFGGVEADMTNRLGFPLTGEVERDQYGFELTLTSGGKSMFEALPLETELEQGRIRVFERRLVDAQSRDWQVLIRYTDGPPFMMMRSTGQGRLLWINGETDFQSSNLALRGLFPPLIQMLAESAIPIGQIARLNAVVGDTLRFLPLSGQTSSDLRILRPDEITDYVQLDSLLQVRYSRSDLPGFYQLFQGRQKVESIAVNIQEIEAQPRAVMDEKRFTTLQTEEDLAQQILAARRTAAIWPHLLALVLLLYVAEMILSRITRHWRPT